VPLDSEHFSSGQWYGNDTIWRTILDINLVLLYGDLSGTINYDKRSRNILTIGDLIIAGEKEGPLTPTPKPLGIILVSNNSAVFDFVFCKITGFDYRLIPTVKNSIHNKLLLNEDIENIHLRSNLQQYNDVPLDSALFPGEWKFVAHPSWEDILK
jgi:hypothetical protein